MTQPKVSRVDPLRLTEWARTGRIRIPHFQRSYVWDASDAERLFDSILRYPADRRARLSPAYDLVCVTAYPKADHKRAFPLGGNTNTELITTESFRGLSPALRLSPELITDTVRETVEAQTASWSGIKHDFEVPEFVAVTIDSRLASLPLVRG
ncbi:hypothetical protein ACFWOJ_00275 [Streptomyces sp. NPDC058439]|uniref:hypothetical protein n=1 Tax=Streptomyces sp. NPDC058439 TaxID=3346500 RepID=UPI00365574A7